jgi:peptidoglycan LD-endopeptidase LytH
VIARLLLLILIAGALWYFRDAEILRTVREAVTTPDPHDQYVRSLHRSGVAETAMGRAWIDAGEQAVAAPPRPITLPFDAAVPVEATRPHAVAYHLSVRRGQRIEVVAAVSGPAPSQVFVDLFDVEDGDDGENGAPTHTAGALRALSHEASEDRAFIVRVQPELLRSGQLRVVARVVPSLLFPVTGVAGHVVGSPFGAPRDGGRRRHEGVDIFARRGTPVVAATGGVVTRVATTGIGGRVVWIWDPSRRLSFYYAHLDEQLVVTGQRVRRGDVIGTVGNTGNARTTAPHLHFGIYVMGSGAIDPDAFIR